MPDQMSGLTINGAMLCYGMMIHVIVTIYFETYLNHRLGHYPPLAPVNAGCYVLHNTNKNMLCRTTRRRSSWIHSFPAAIDQHKLAARFGPTYDEMEACWKADSWNINPTNSTSIDAILQCLSSPAPQSFYVIDRAIRIVNRQRYDSGDLPNLAEALQHFDYLLKPGFKLVIVQEGNCNNSNVNPIWGVIPINQTADQGWRVVDKIKTSTVLEMAYDTLSVVMDASENRYCVGDLFLNKKASEALDRLGWTLGTDIRGRSAADTALSLALAGLRDNAVFQTLAYVTELELARVGGRNAFRPKFVLQIVEKLAAAGVKDDDVRGVHRNAARCLALKNQYRDIADVLSRNDNRFDLFSPRSLLWLWRYSSRLNKVKDVEMSDTDASMSGANEQPYNHRSHCWWEKFNDSSRPLVIDVGCGLGVSLLGLASLSRDEIAMFDRCREACALGNINFTKCNYLGADLNNLGIGFAKGVTERWHLGGRLQFVCLSAEQLMAEVSRYYAGPVVLVLIQFPTPFRFQGKETGNAQLPVFSQSGFMVSPSLLSRIAELLRRSGGRLLMQSNCEDVAVYMHSVAMNEIGKDYIAAPNPVMLEGDHFCARLPLRTQLWVQQGGKRAFGVNWSSNSFLPSRAATETEAACQFQSTPIHRCMFRVSTTVIYDMGRNEYFQ